MEQLIATLIKTNKALSSSINQLISKFNAMAVHQKIMDTQIAQQVNGLSKSQGNYQASLKLTPGAMSTPFLQ